MSCDWRFHISSLWLKYARLHLWYNMTFILWLCSPVHVWICGSIWSNYQLVFGIEVCLAHDFLIAVHGMTNMNRTKIVQWLPVKRITTNNIVWKQAIKRAISFPISTWLENGMGKGFAKVAILLYMILPISPVPIRKRKLPYPRKFIRNIICCKIN